MHADVPSAGASISHGGSYRTSVAITKCLADDAVAEESWTLSGWQEEPSVPESARIASAKLSKHKSAAHSRSNSSSPARRIVAAAQQQAKAQSPLAANRRTSKPQVVASSMRYTAVPQRAAVQPARQQQVQHQQLRQENGEESDGETAAQHYCPMPLSAAAQGISKATAGAPSSRIAAYAADNFAHVQQIVGSSMDTNLPETSSASSANSCPSFARELSNANCRTSSATALCPTLSSSGDTVSPAGLAAVQDQQAAITVAAAREQPSHAGQVWQRDVSLPPFPLSQQSVAAAAAAAADLQAAGTAAESLSDPGQQQKQSSVVGRAVAAGLASLSGLSSLSSSLSPVAPALAGLASPQSPGRGALHLGSAFRRCQSCIGAQAGTATAGADGNSTGFTTRSVSGSDSSNPAAAAAAGVVLLEAQPMGGPGQQQQHQWRQQQRQLQQQTGDPPSAVGPMLADTSEKHQQALHTTTAAPSGATGGAGQQQLVPFSSAVVAGCTAAATSIGKLNDLPRSSSGIASKVVSSTGTVNLGSSFIGSSIGALQQRLLPSQLYNAATLKRHVSRNSHAAGSQTILGGQAVKHTGNASSNSDAGASSRGVSINGSNSGHKLHGRLATTGIAAQAQMLLMKDLATPGGKATAWARQQQATATPPAAALPQAGGAGLAAMGGVGSGAAGSADHLLGLCAQQGPPPSSQQQQPALTAILRSITTKHAPAVGIQQQQQGGTATAAGYRGSERGGLSRTWGANGTNPTASVSNSLTAGPGAAGTVHAAIAGAAAIDDVRARPLSAGSQRRASRPSSADITGLRAFGHAASTVSRELVPGNSQLNSQGLAAAAEYEAGKATVDELLQSINRSRQAAVPARHPL